jgi:hypothetical protein
MTYNRTFEIIIKDIQDIEKLVSNFNNYSHIPKIELDLALSKLRNLYDLLLMYRDLEETDPSETEKKVYPVNKPGINEQVPESIVPKPIVPDPILPDKGFANKEGVIKTDDLLLEAEEKVDKSGVTNPPSAKETSENRMETELPKDKKPGESTKQNILSERFIGQKEFIYEKLGENNKKDDISSRIGSSPIQSIAGSIGINDKFFFVRELFNGDAIKFRETMNDLDAMSDFSSAQEYLNNNFQWDMESSTVSQLLNLIRRKLILSANE